MWHRVKGFLDVEENHTSQKVINRTIWRYNQADFDQATELLETTEWDLTIPQECCDVDAYWLAWKNYFMQVVQMCVPRATVKVKTNVPWMNQTIHKAMKKCDSLFRVAKRSSDPTHWSKYKRQRNYVVTLLRKSKREFFQQLNTRDAKTFWKTVRILNRQEFLIPALEVNNTIIDTGLDKACAMNNLNGWQLKPPRREN